jgi:hypothetical protein
MLDDKKHSSSVYPVYVIKKDFEIAMAKVLGQERKRGLGGLHAEMGD